MSATRCALYVRSTSYGPSARLQIDGLQAFATKAGMEIVDIFEDTDDQEDRTGLSDAIGAAREGQYDAFLVWGLDRLDTLAGSSDKIFRLIGDLSMVGVRFISVREEIDSASAGADLITSVLGAIERARGEIKGERIHKSLSISRAEGEPVGRPRKRDDTKIRELRARGMSIREIAEEMGISTWSVHASLKKAREEGLDQS